MTRLDPCLTYRVNKMQLASVQHLLAEAITPPRQPEY